MKIKGDEIRAQKKKHLENKVSKLEGIFFYYLTNLFALKQEYFLSDSLSLSNNSLTSSLLYCDTALTKVYVATCLKSLNSFSCSYGLRHVLLFIPHFPLTDNFSLGCADKTNWQICQVSEHKHCSQSWRQNTHMHTHTQWMKKLNRKALIEHVCTQKLSFTTAHEWISGTLRTRLVWVNLDILWRCGMFIMWLQC